MELPHPLGDFKPIKQTVSVAHMVQDHGYRTNTMLSLGATDRDAIHDKIHEDVKAGKARLEFPHHHEGES